MGLRAASVSTAGSLFLNFSKNGRRGVDGGSTAEGTLGGSWGGDSTRSRRSEALIGLVGEDAMPAVWCVGVMFGDLPGDAGSLSPGDFCEYGECGDSDAVPDPGDRGGVFAAVGSIHVSLCATDVPTSRERTISGRGTNIQESGRVRPPAIHALYLYRMLRIRAGGSHHRCRCGSHREHSSPRSSSESAPSNARHTRFSPGLGIRLRRARGTRGHWWGRSPSRRWPRTSTTHKRRAL